MILLHKMITLMELRSLFPMGHASFWVWNILQFALICISELWHLLNWPWDKHIHLTGIEIDEFVEISSELLQPLEDFFNNVFVMVVCFLQDSIIFIINVYIRCWKLHLRFLSLISMLSSCLTLSHSVSLPMKCADYPCFNCFANYFLYQLAYNCY
jgi:hypothetical protein